MSDLAKSLLSQYYGLNSELTDRKFVSIHESIENIKTEQEKQFTGQISDITNEENIISGDEYQKDIDDEWKLSPEIEEYRRPVRAFNNIEDAYESDENSIIYEIDLKQNITRNTNLNTEFVTERTEFPNIIPVVVAKENYLKDTNESDSSRMYAEDIFPDNVSKASGTALKKSQRSSKIINTPLPPISKKKPVCNEIFADFSNADLKDFPPKILNEFSQLKMLYLNDNSLTKLPNEIFTTLRHLEWLDVRNNQISSLPNSIESHQCIQTLLLQANNLKELPLELCTAPRLKTLHVAQNILVTPPKDIVALGSTAILEFLRIEWNKLHPERQIEFKEYKIEPKLSTILCYQSPRKSKKKIPSKLQVHDKNISIKEKCKTYKPSNRCESKNANASVERRILWYSRAKDLLIKQASILQKVKDENVLKEWRRDKRKFNIAMEKAVRRNEDDIPFGFDLEDYATIFKQKHKLNTTKSKEKRKQIFNSPEDINIKMNELLESLNNLETKTADAVTPRSKQSLLKKDIEKILQFQNEIKDLRKYNDVATMSLKM